MILVLTEHGIFQINALIFLSLAYCSYMIIAQPFDEQHLNYLETFNEIIILVCCYHLLFFSDANPYFRLKYEAGWSLVILICVQFIINIVTYLFVSISRIRFIIKTYQSRQILRKQKLYALTAETFNDMNQVDNNFEKAKDNKKLKQNFELNTNQDEPLQLKRDIFQDGRIYDEDYGLAYKFEETSNNILGKTMTRQENHLQNQDYIKNQILPHQVRTMKMIRLFPNENNLFERPK